MSVSPEKVHDTVEWLAQYGNHGEDGMIRLLYSQEWLDAQNALKERFESLGMVAEFDAVGNLKATLKGSDGSDETVATGSHVDTVVNGGKLDGAFGIEAGLLAVEELVKTYGQPKKNLAVFSFAEEEGSRFPYVFWGSKNLFNLQNNDEMTSIVDSDGVSFVDAMHKCGFDFATSRNTFMDDVKNFIEIHIEQGNTLEMEHKSVGAVNAIAGQFRYNIYLYGEANHAGTTMMRYRHDVVQAYAEIVSRSIKRAKEEGDPLVLTFGKAEIKPNVVNVVPGEMMFTMDCRHTDMDFLTKFTDSVVVEMKQIADEMGIKIFIDNWMREEPTPMDPKMVEVVKQACETKGLDWREMHSGAGHDSQIIAKHIPCAMIFVPSIKGISHNPAEETDVKDLKQGVDALVEALHTLAY